MSKIIRSFFAVPVLLLCASCGMFSSGQVVLTEKDSGSVINVKTGDTIVIRLEANPTTGYLWTTSVPDDMVVREIDSRYVPFKDQPQGLAGAPSTKVFTYVVTGPGEAGIKMEYKRPWESGKAPEKTFDVMLRATGESTIRNDTDGHDGTRRVGSRGQVEFR